MFSSTLTRSLVLPEICFGHVPCDLILACYADCGYPNQGKLIKVYDHCCNNVNHFSFVSSMWILSAFGY